MIGLAVFLFICAGVCAILGSVDQRKLYWGLQSWAYRRPEANEPSDASYAVQRFAYWFGAIAFTIMGFVLISAHQSSIADASDVEMAARHAATAIRDPDDWWLSFPTASDVAQAARESHRDIEVTDRGNDRYELTNSRGEHPVCLTVQVEGRLLGEPSVITGVDPGRC